MIESRLEQRKKKLLVNMLIKYKLFESLLISRLGNRGDVGYQVIEFYGDGWIRGFNNFVELCF